jgi:hypothetical protein
MSLIVAFLMIVALVNAGHYLLLWLFGPNQRPR